MFKELDTVVLKTDIPDKKLYTGDLGVIVDVYSEHDVEVEFVTGDGHTVASLGLKTDNIRHILLA